MNWQRCCTCILCLLCFLLFLSLFQFVYEYKINSFPIVVLRRNQTVENSIQLQRTSSDELLLDHIERCPECFLFLLTKTENETIFNILNRISNKSKAKFYPLTMNLFYNQPIRFDTIGSKNPFETLASKRRFWIEQIEKQTSINTTSLLYSILNSLKKPQRNFIETNRTKLILYYTKFFGNSFWYNSDEKSVYENDLNPLNCPISVNACRVTIDHRLFSQSDASLIHLRETIDYRQLNALPRENRQRFVFFLKESPVHSPILTREKHGHLFNYTQTYRPDSDVTATTLRDLFWFFDEKIHLNFDFQSILRTKQPNKVAVAIISNCGDSSSRLKYIDELKKFIPVDVYGRCGRSCPKSVDCRQFAYSTYKFYLSFENSLCDEYVTEKFFYALQSGQIIPVVLGLAKYSDYVPSSAFIDVRQFSSPKHLATHLNFLNENSDAFLQYFHWRQYALMIKPPKYICELCLKLFFDDQNDSRQTLTTIDRYWNRENQCRSFRKENNGTWRMI